MVPSLAMLHVTTSLRWPTDQYDVAVLPPAKLSLKAVRGLPSVMPKGTYTVLLPADDTARMAP